MVEKKYGRVLERKRQNGSGPVERSRSEEMKTVRNGLRWLPPGARVMSEPDLLPRSMSGFMKLL